MSGLWNKPEPPKKHGKLICLRYAYLNDEPQTATFSWSDQEKAFIECVEGPDGIGLYPDDGWRILAWRTP